ncbi:MAG: hypothetical protein JWM57_3963 [Phycisphaerales bacterium]|nr:hypothetical protein [Phycisphaerales bacterium]
MPGMSSSAQQIDFRPWQPGPAVTDVKGKPLGGDFDFFIQPPSEIGEVLKAYSEVKVGKTLWPMSIKIALAAVMTIVGVACLIWVSHATGKKADAPHLIALLAGLMLPVVGFALVYRQKVLGYVGTEGAAVYHTRGGRGDAKAQIMLLSDIADVQVKIRKDRKGHTSWTSYFRDASGQRRITLRGNVTKKLGHTMVVGPYFLNEAIGDACTAHAKAAGFEPIVLQI